MKPQQAPLTWLWLVPLLLLSGALALRLLTGDLLFVDEYWTLRYSGGGRFGPYTLSEIWHVLATQEPGGMGVLYHWLIAAWERVFGPSTFSLRLFSWIAGLLTIAWVYRLGKDMLSARAGLYAAAIIATSAFFVDYLHEARAYTLTALFTVVAVWAYWHLCNRPASHPRRVYYITLALMLAALAYTHYIALAIGAGLGLHHLLTFRRRREWWLTLLAIVAGGLLFLPWMGITLQVIENGASDTNRQSGSMAAPQIVHDLGYLFSSGNLGLLLVALGLALRVRRRALGLLLLLVAVVLGLIILVNTLIPFVVHPRYMLLLWPLLALLVGFGFTMLRMLAAGMALWLLVVWMALGSLQSLNPAFIEAVHGQIYRAPRPAFNATLDVLDEVGQPGDAALFHIIPPGDEPFNYFILGYHMDHRPFVYDQIERMNRSFAGGDNDYLRDVQTILEGADFAFTIVMPHLETTQRTGVVNYVLNTQYDACDVLLDRPDMRMTRYAHRSLFDAVARFGDGGIQAGMLQALPQTTQGQLDVLLGWSLASDVPQDTYNVALHIYDDAGALVAQTDFSLPGDRDGFACEAATVALDDVPPGDYTFNLLVYNWQTGERLPLTDGPDNATVQQLARLTISDTDG